MASTDEVEEHEVKVVCPKCGGKHKLFPGIDAPIYWCGNDLKVLKAGDEIEYDDTLEGIPETIKKRGRFLGLPLRHWDFLIRTGKFPVK